MPNRTLLGYFLHHMSAVILIKLTTVVGSLQNTPKVQVETAKSIVMENVYVIEQTQSVCILTIMLTSISK